MHTYVVGHSEYSAHNERVKLPRGVRFFTMEDTRLPKVFGVGLLSLDTHGVQVHANEETEVPNYQFWNPDGRDVNAIFATVAEERVGELIFVGAMESPVASGMRLCGRGDAECLAGAHGSRCGGILGLFHGYEIDFISCRNLAGGPSLDVMEHDQLGDLHEGMAMMLERLDRESGLSFEEKFSGYLPDSFAAEWDDLPEGSRATLLYTRRVWAWYELRAAYTASDGFVNREQLGKYVASQYTYGNADLVNLLLEQPVIIQNLTEMHFAQVVAIDQLYAGTLRDYYLGCTPEERTYIKEHPFLRKHVARIERRMA